MSHVTSDINELLLLFLPAVLVVGFMLFLSLLTVDAIELFWRLLLQLLFSLSFSGSGALKAISLTLHARDILDSTDTVSS